MISLKASMRCRSKSFVCLDKRSAVFIKFLAARGAQCRLKIYRCRGMGRASVCDGKRAAQEHDTEKASQHWWRWVEPWYVVYALVGIAMSGAAPLLLPLAVSRVGNAADIGLVMPALSFGGLTA